MKYTSDHESKNSIRIRCESLRNMTADEADILRFELMNDPGIQKVDLYRKTGGVRITYDCPRSEIIKLLNILDIEDIEIVKDYLIRHPEEEDYLGSDELLRRHLAPELKRDLRKRIVMEAVADLVMPTPIQLGYHLYQFVTLKKL